MTATKGYGTTGQENAVGNKVYPELVMSRYPEYLDKRGVNDAGGNENFNLHRNLQDYNLAEHVNSLADAIMAIQKTLGTAPQLPTVVKDDNGNVITNTTSLISLMKTKTVKSRLDILENKNFDKRYGGPDWLDGERNTIQEHKHTGIGRSPSKIDLTSEIQGKIPVTNINLEYSSKTGMTGADISINATTKTSIDATINDKLSKKEGGVIEKNLEVKGRSLSRLHRDYDTSSLIGDIENDTTASFGSAIFKNNNTSHTFINEKLSDMYFCRYVMVVRMKTSTQVDANLIQLSTVNNNGVPVEKVILKGTDFKAQNTWQNFYLVFYHEPNKTTATGGFMVQKLGTAENVKVSIDYVSIMPTHPAVFDK